MNIINADISRVVIHQVAEMYSAYDMQCESATLRAGELARRFSQYTGCYALSW